MLRRILGGGNKESKVDVEEGKQSAKAGGRTYSIAPPEKEKRGRRTLSNLFRRRSATPDFRTLNIRVGASEPPSPQSASMKDVITQLKKRDGVSTANNSPRTSTEDVYKGHHRRGSSAHPLPSPNLKPELNGKNWEAVQANPFLQDRVQFEALMKLIADESIALRLDPLEKNVCTAFKLAKGDLQNDLADSIWDAFENHNHHLEPSQVEKYLQKAAKRVARWNEIFSNDCFYDEPIFNALIAFGQKRAQKSDIYSKTFFALVQRAKSLVDGGHTVERAALNCLTTKTIVVQSGSQDIDGHLEGIVAILREFDRIPKIVTVDSQDS
ncbi:MAG: hypothetical protein K1X28_08215 [Parachlamydiales bacterium]|nr:hypothetical protein [Parachlamydiales bacterium]